MILRTKHIDEEQQILIIEVIMRSNHEVDSVTSHRLGAAVALSLEKQYKTEGNNPYGISQPKSLGSPTAKGNIKSIIEKHS